MIGHRATQILALIRSGNQPKENPATEKYPTAKTINIWRQTCARVQPLPTRNPTRSHLFDPAGAGLRCDLPRLGIHLPRNTLRSRDHSAARDRRHPALDRRSDHAGVGLDARLSPHARALDFGMRFGRALLSDWSRYAALGRTVRRLRSGGLAYRHRTDVHRGSGVVDRAAEDQPAERAGPGFGRA